MSALAAYGRLLWRPRMALDLPYWLFVGLLGCLLVGRLHRPPGEDLAAGLARSGRLLLLALPLVLGIWASLPLRDLLGRPFAWNLPRVRGRQGLALGVLGGAVALLTVGGLAWAGWLAVPAVPAAALASLGFAAGLLVMDETQPRPLLTRGALLLGLLAASVASEALWNLIASWPVVASLAFAGGAAWLLLRCVSREAARTLALASSTQAGSRWARERGASGASPPLEPRAQRPWSWVRAALYEATGHRRPSFARQLGLVALLFPAMACAMFLGSGYRVGGTFDAALAMGHQGLVRTCAALDDNLTQFLLPFFVMMFLLALTPLRFAVQPPELLQPMSRGDRAAILWRFKLVTDLALMLAMATGLFVAAELVTWGAGFDDRGAPLPNWVRAVAVALFLAPAGHWLLRAGAAGTPARGLSMAVQGPRQLLRAVALPSLGVILFNLWGYGVELLPAGAWAAIVLALLTGSQLLYRRFLRRMYARRDLI